MSSFRINKNTDNYILDGINVVMDGNLQINGSLSSYLDITLNSLPENSISTLSGLSSETNKWYGGVLASNGNIYFIPYNSSSILIVNPKRNLVYTTSAISSNSSKWIGGVLAPNGNIYCCPDSQDSVLIIYPNFNSFDIRTITGLGSSSGKWSGAVLSPNGKIYCIPRNNSSVLTINPSLNTVDTTTLVGLGSGTDKWWGGALAPNGKIYGTPHSSSSVLVLDPDSPIVSLTGTHTLATYDDSTRLLSGSGSSFQTELTIGDNVIITTSAGSTYTGHIEFISSQTSLKLALQLGVSLTVAGNITNLQRTKRADIETIQGLSTALWRGSVLAPNGKIYSMPSGSSSVLITDPQSSLINLTGNHSSASYSGTTLTGSGSLFTTELVAGDLITISTTTTTYYATVSGAPASNTSLTVSPSLGITLTAGSITNLQKSAVTITQGVIGDAKYNNTTYILTGVDTFFLTELSVGDNVIITSSTLATTFTGYVEYIINNQNLKFVLPLGTTGLTAGNISRIQRALRRVDITSIQGLPTTNTYDGGVLSMNGKIYAIPKDSTRGLIIDPDSPVTSYTNSSFTGTISGSTNNCVFTGTIDNGSGGAGTVLTVTSITSGTITVGMLLTNGSISAGTTITALGTGTGYLGTYFVNNSQTLGSTIIVGSLSSNNILNATSTPSKPITLGMPITGTGVASNSRVSDYLFGSGGIGSYKLSTNTNGSVFTGSISGNTLTVSAVSSGTLAVGMPISGAGIITNNAIFVGSSSGTTLTVATLTSGYITTGMILSGLYVTTGTSIVTQLTGTAGGAGTYTISISQTIPASTTVTGSGPTIIDAQLTGSAGGVGTYRLLSSLSLTNVYTPTTITGTIDNGSGSSGNILNVSAISGGSVYFGMTVVGGTISANTRVVGFLSGTGGTGTYLVDNPAQLVSSTSITGSLGSTTLYGGLASTTITGVPDTKLNSALFTGSATASTTLGVSAVASGTITVGMIISGTGITAGTKIIAQTSGTAGGTGNYTMSGVAQTFTSVITTGIPDFTQFNYVNSTGILSASNGSTGALAGGTTFSMDIAVGDNVIITTTSGFATPTTYTGYVESLVTFTGRINSGVDGVAGTTLTVNSVLTGTISTGMMLSASSGASAGTIIQSGSGLSWVVNNSQNLGTSTAPVLFVSDSTLKFVFPLGSDITSSNILKIERTRKADVTTITGLTGTDKYAGGVLSQDNNVYATPYSASNILQIKGGIQSQQDWALKPYFNKY